MNWFVTLFFGAAGIVQGIIQFAFSSLFSGKKPAVMRCAVYLLLFEAAGFMGTAFRSSLLSALLNILALYWANRFLLRNERLISGLTTVLAVSVTQLCYGILNALLFLVLPYVESSVLLPLSELVGMTGTVLSLALCFFCCRLIWRYFALKGEMPGRYLPMILAPVLLFFVMGFYVINTVYGNVVEIPFRAEPGKQMELLAIQLLGLGAMFSTLYAYRRLCESFETTSKLALLEQEARAQKTYVAEARARYDQTKAFRHDIKNHLSVLSGLLKTGQTEQAGTYLEKLESVTGELSFPVQTGNPVVDILLGSKLGLAAQRGIETELSVALPQPCAVEDLDLCVIFSNAMDNAIRACGQADGPGTIRIAGERQGDFYLLEFENSCRPEPAGGTETGTGLSNIRTAAEKYGGAVTIERRDGRFCLDILLNIS